MEDKASKHTALTSATEYAGLGWHFSQQSPPPSRQGGLSGRQGCHGEHSPSQVPSEITIRSHNTYRQVPSEITKSDTDGISCKSASFLVHGK